MGVHHVSGFSNGIGDAIAESNSASAVWKLFLKIFSSRIDASDYALPCFFFWLFAGAAADSLGAAAKIANTDLVDYAEVRKRVTRSFPEKAYEIADVIAVLQELSRNTLDLSTQISAHCS